MICHIGYAIGLHLAKGLLASFRALFSIFEAACRSPADYHAGLLTRHIRPAEISYDMK